MFYLPNEERVSNRIDYYLSARKDPFYELAHILTIGYDLKILTEKVQELGYLDQGTNSKYYSYYDEDFNPYDATAHGSGYWFIYDPVTVEEIKINLNTRKIICILINENTLTSCLSYIFHKSML